MDNKREHLEQIEKRYGINFSDNNNKAIFYYNYITDRPWGWQLNSELDIGTNSETIFRKNLKKIL